jgi:hypothetical protein
VVVSLLVGAVAVGAAVVLVVKQRRKQHGSAIAGHGTHGDITVNPAVAGSWYEVPGVAAGSSSRDLANRTYLEPVAIARSAFGGGDFSDDNSTYLEPVATARSGFGGVGGGVGGGDGSELYYAGMSDVDVEYAAVDDHPRDSIIDGGRDVDGAVYSTLPNGDASYAAGFGGGREGGRELYEVPVGGSAGPGSGVVGLSEDATYDLPMGGEPTYSDVAAPAVGTGNTAYRDVAPHKPTSKGRGVTSQVGPDYIDQLHDVDDGGPAYLVPVAQNKKADEGVYADGLAIDDPDDEATYGFGAQ